MILAILTTISSAETEKPGTDLILDSGDMYTCPAIAPWPDDLPDSTKQAGGRLLPDPLYREVIRRVAGLDAYVPVCQEMVDGLNKALTVEHSEALKVARARHDLELVKCQAGCDPGWSTLDVVGSFGIGAVLGIVITWIAVSDMQ
jgi:hypothetical protein